MSAASTLLTRVTLQTRGVAARRAGEPEKSRHEPAFCLVPVAEFRHNNCANGG
jgi:hypothetical protein